MKLSFLFLFFVAFSSVTQAIQPSSAGVVELPISGSLYTSSSQAVILNSSQRNVFAQTRNLGATFNLASSSLLGTVPAPHLYTEKISATPGPNKSVLVAALDIESPGAVAARPTISNINSDGTLAWQISLAPVNGAYFKCQITHEMGSPFAFASFGSNWSTEPNRIVVIDLSTHQVVNQISIGDGAYPISHLQSFGQTGAIFYVYNGIRHLSTLPGASSTLVASSFGTYIYSIASIREANGSAFIFVGVNNGDLNVVKLAPNQLSETFADPRYLRTVVNLNTTPQGQENISRIAVMVAKNLPGAPIYLATAQEKTFDITHPLLRMIRFDRGTGDQSMVLTSSLLATRNLDTSILYAGANVGGAFYGGGVSLGRRFVFGLGRIYPSWSPGQTPGGLIVGFRLLVDGTVVSTQDQAISNSTLAGELNFSPLGDKISYFTNGDPTNGNTNVAQVLTVDPDLFHIEGSTGNTFSLHINAEENRNQRCLVLRTTTPLTAAALRAMSVTTAGFQIAGGLQLDTNGNGTLYQGLRLLPAIPGVDYWYTLLCASASQAPRFVDQIQFVRFEQ